MLIDTKFDFHSDSKGRDPDSFSPTLRRYHKHLWSKQLPNGSHFELTDANPGSYLYHKSEKGEFYLGSDSITHSYKNQKRKKWIVERIPAAVDELFAIGSTIGAFLVFPNNQIGRKNTINQARGVASLIDDRFDLTLECIRRFYLGIENPLYATLQRYSAFFDLFGSFDGYVDFFLLDDLLGKDRNIQFYLPFTDFETRPVFSSIEDYLTYKTHVTRFVESRNKRIDTYANS